MDSCFYLSALSLSINIPLPPCELLHSLRLHVPLTLPQARTHAVALSIHAEDPTTPEPQPQEGSRSAFTSDCRTPSTSSTAFPARCGRKDDPTEATRADGQSKAFRCACLTLSVIFPYEIFLYLSLSPCLTAFSGSFLTSQKSRHLPQLSLPLQLLNRPLATKRSRHRRQTKRTSFFFPKRKRTSPRRNDIRARFRTASLTLEG
jgi:hypothetical protein